MKFVIVVSLILSSVVVFAQAPANEKGLSQVSIGATGWLRISGAPAKKLFEGLKVTETNDPGRGEAGPTVYFKDGESYSCWQDRGITTVDGYACFIMISDPSKGIISK